MVRIPDSAVSVGLPAVSAQPIREAAQIGGAVVGLTEAGTEFASRLAEAQKAADLSSRSGAMAEAFSELQLELQRDPSLNTVDSIEAAWDAGSAGIAEEHLDQSDSEAIDRALSAQFVKSNLRSRIAVSQSGFTREKDAAIAARDAEDRQLENVYALIPPGFVGDEVRADIRGMQARNTNLSGYETEVAKFKRIERFALRTDTAHVRGMIDGGLFDDAEDILFDPTQLTGMDELKRQAMLRTLNSARDRADKKAARELKSHEDDTAKAAFLAIRDGEYSEAELENDSTSLSFQNLRTVAAALDNQGVITISDPLAVDLLNQGIENGDIDVIDRIHSAFRGNFILEGTFNGLLAKNQSLNDGSPEASAYKQEIKNIRNALKASEFETEFKVRQDAVDRTQNALNDFEDFRLARPNATRAQIKVEGQRIRDAFGQLSLSKAATRAVPYSLGKRERLTAEELDDADAKLGDDSNAGLVDDRTFTREAANIQVYRDELTRDALQSADQGAAR